MAKNPAHRPPGAHQFVTLLEQLAVGSYGPGWERRGRIALGAATAVLAAAFPAAALGLTSGATGLTHGAAHLAGKVGAKGLLPVDRPRVRCRNRPSAYHQTDTGATTSTYTVTVPKESALKHGAYLLSPIGRPRITDIAIGPKRDTFFDPKNAGAQAEGSLPRVTVLP